MGLICKIERMSRTNLEDVNLWPCWISEGDVFKLNQTSAGVWSLGALRWMFGFPVQILKHLLSCSDSLHEASVD